MERRRERHGRRRSRAAALLVTIAMIGTATRSVLAASVADALRALPVQRHGATIPLGRTLDPNAPAVVAMWASYCVECRGESGLLLGLRKRWAAQGLQVMVVLADVADPKVAARFRQQTSTAVDLLPVAPRQEDVVDELAPEGYPTNYLLAGDRVTRIDRLLTKEDVAGFLGGR